MYNLFHTLFSVSKIASYTFSFVFLLNIMFNGETYALPILISYMGILIACLSILVSLPLILTINKPSNTDHILDSPSLNSQSNIELPLFDGRYKIIGWVLFISSLLCIPAYISQLNATEFLLSRFLIILFQFFALPLIFHEFGGHINRSAH